MATSSAFVSVSASFVVSPAVVDLEPGSAAFGSAAFSVGRLEALGEAGYEPGSTALLFFFFLRVNSFG